MNMISVSSSDISSIGYESNTLYITFNRGGTYSYSGVPQSVYQGLMSAASKGSYFHEHVRNNYTPHKLG